MSTRPAKTRRTFALVLTAGATMAASTFAAEREASAEIASTIASTLVKNAISCAINDGFQKVLSTCLLTGGSSGSGLSSSDLDDISTAIKNDLVNFNAGNYTAQADTILGYVKNYYRGTTCADLGATDSGALWKVNQILSWTDNVMSLASSSSVGLSGASTYYTLAPIQVAFYKEKFEIMRLLNEGACTSYTSGSLYSTGTLANAIATAADKAGDAAAQLDSFNDLLDAAFTSVTKVTTKKDVSWGDPFSDTCAYGTWKHTSKYCYTGPSGQVCGESQTWYTYAEDWCDQNSGSENATTLSKSKAQAEIYRKQEMISYRQEMIGIGVHETIETFEKAATSFDFEYCGNGSCGIGEIDTCSTDCGSGTSAKWIEKSPGYSTSTSGNLVGAPGSTDATLKLSSGILSIEDNWLGRTRWSTKSTYSSYGANHTFAFSTTGDVSLYTVGSSGSAYPWWETDTIAASSTDTTNKATRMVLLGKQMYLLNAVGATVWASDRDPMMLAETSESFCYELPSADQTILVADPYLADEWMNSTDNKKKLIWTTGGELIIKDSGTQKWSSGTSGSGKYLCNQEDGNFVIYNETGTAIWGAKAGQRGRSGRLQLVDDQVRVTASSGDVRWGSTSCSYDTCAYGVRSQSGTFTYTKSTSDQTVLGSGKAKLVFTSTGDLQILDRTTGATLWSAGTSGSGNKLVFQQNSYYPVLTGNWLQVLNSSGNVIWTATSNTGTAVYLADCSMYIANGSKTPAYSTGTVCDYVDRGLTVTGSDGTKTYTTAELLSDY